MTSNCFELWQQIKNLHFKIELIKQDFNKSPLFLRKEYFQLSKQFTQITGQVMKEDNINMEQLAQTLQVVISN